MCQVVFVDGPLAGSTRIGELPRCVLDGKSAIAISEAKGISVYRLAGFDKQGRLQAHIESVSHDAK